MDESELYKVKNELNGVKTDVELVKRDVSSMQGLLSRLDTAIDRIAEVSADISKMLALHSEKIDNIRDDADERKRISEKETELLHRRISDMKEESAEERKANHKAVIDTLTDMRKEIRDEINGLRDDHKALTNRVGLLERWKWWIMGGSWVIGFVIATLLQLGSWADFFGGN